MTDQAAVMRKIWARSDVTPLLVRRAEVQSGLILYKSAVLTLLSAMLQFFCVL